MEVNYRGINRGPIEKPLEVYIYGIPGLRTLGIFGVILYHMFPYTIKGGFLGVTLFFLIAGYLLAVKSEEARRLKSFNIVGFYVKRIKRLYPQLLVVLFATCGICSFILPNALMGIRPEIFSIVFGYNNYWQIAQNGSYFERIANSSPFTHMWSLSNELHVYLIWPAIFFLFIYCTKKLGTKRAIDIIGILAVLTALIMPIMYNPEVDVTRIYYGTDTRLFSFLTGAYIGFKRVRYKRHVNLKSVNGRVFAFCGLTVLVLISYIFMDGQAAITYRGGMFVINIIMGMMLMLVTDTRLPIGRFLEAKAFRFFGDVSYEMYLIMYPVIYIFACMRWNRFFGSHIFMMVLIVLLARWLNVFARVLVKRKFIIMKEGKPAKNVVRICVLCVSVLIVLIAFRGVYSVGTAPGKDNSELNAMKEELEANKELLNGQSQSDSTSESTSASDSSENTDDVDNGDDNTDSVETDDIKTDDDGDSSTEEEKPGYLDIPVEERTVTAIGDSVMLGASPALLEAIPGSFVDAAESRQAKKGLEIIKGIESDGNLGNTIVIALGTNGPFKESVGQEIIDYLGTDRMIYWVNVYGETVQWMDESNSVIDALCENNENVELIDWANEGPKHPEWFYKDGIHLKLEGQKGYAEFVSGIVMK